MSARAWLVVVAFALGGCLRYYRLELTRQKLGVADAIIVPGFELTDDGRAPPLLHNRVAMAQVLMAGGYGTHLIVSGGKPKQGVTEAEKMLELATRFGVRPEQVIVEPEAHTSLENAERSADLMVKHGFSSALVVTDAGHLSYCIPVFKDAFRARGLVLYWTPVDYALLRRLGRLRPLMASPE